MDNMIVRISDIKIYPEYLNEYLTYAKEVVETSMEKEKDVIALYPMIVIKDNTQIKILEIYKNQVAYE
ncbi:MULTISPECIES: hypothetical protein [unclassified Campylobacter]|nr:MULTISPECIES: hypothetical protein [unclassified Campylobacter]